jgi:predicted transcriptional regulator
VLHDYLKYRIVALHLTKQSNSFLGEALYLSILKKGGTLVEMLMVKRTTLEIMAEILGLCEQPQTKTRVMYRTNLSWEMVQKYLSQLQSRGLLEVHHSSTKYQTTRKGLKFVDKWRELIELL